MIRVTLEIRGFGDVNYVRKTFTREFKQFSDNVKISVEEVCEIPEDDELRYDRYEG